MKLIVLFGFFLIYPFLSQAQDYNWKWAIKGGGNTGGSGFELNDEQIYDIKVGTDNNYYFIASIIGKTNVNLNNNSVKVYNRSFGETRDIFIFSTTCDGEIRWSQAIGGGNDDSAYNIVLDNKNNVYVGAYVRNDYITPDGQTVHFSSTDSIAYPVSIPGDNAGLIPQEGYKTIYLIKYSSTGSYLGKKALQGDVGAVDGVQGGLLNLAIDSQNKLHFIVGLTRGKHLDNKVTVPNEFGYNPNSNESPTRQYHLVQYDSNLNYVNSLVLPLSKESVFFLENTKFAYDEIKKIFYIAGERMGAPLVPVVYNNTPVINRSYLLAIDANTGSELWRRELYSDPLKSSNSPPYNTINSILVDTDSSVYIGGYVWKNYNDNSLKIYDPSNSSVQPYFITTNVWVWANLPMVAKLNSKGVVQWVKVPTDFAVDSELSPVLRPQGLVINGKEIAFASGESTFKWDGFTQNYPKYYQPDPTLLRFDKQTGVTLGMHTIPGDSNSPQYMKAVAADMDGNYITGGAFSANLFLKNDKGIKPLISTGQADFFIAKLEDSPCGSGNLNNVIFHDKQFILYPNPTTGFVFINTSEILQSYNVYDSTGKLVRHGGFEKQNFINFQNLDNGLYFIKITTEKGDTHTSNLIKR